MFAALPLTIPEKKVFFWIRESFDAENDKQIFTINNHRFLCVCGGVSAPSAPLSGPIFMIVSYFDGEFTGDDARLFHFSFGDLEASVLR